MSIAIFFEPIDNQFDNSLYLTNQIGQVVAKHIKKGEFPLEEGIDIAIIGITEDRKSVNNEGCRNAPDEVRKQFYKLYNGSWHKKIVDFGNIKHGYSITDTYFAVTKTLVHCISNRIFPIIIGGGQDLTYSMYKAYEELNQIINIAVIDPKFDFGDIESDLNSNNYLSHIVSQMPNYLFNFTNIGYQTYLNSQESIDLMKNLLFDTWRLGIVKNDIEITEPLVRSADLISFDVSSIRASEAPANNNALPIGFNGEQICQIIRYATISDKLTSIGFFELNPYYEINNITSMLLSQVIWYAIDGFNYRIKDIPTANNTDYIKYTVPSDDFTDEIVYLKSKKTGRWWMQLTNNHKNNFAKHLLIPCTINDYNISTKGEIPDRLWQMYQKLM